jgi:NTP pyrophosphatase (non-canonical NTP hydrolase)
MSFADYEMRVIRWSEQRGIIQNSTPEAQFLKLVSEVGELADALNKGNMEEVKDAIGDCTVVMLNICALLDVDMTECLAGAWEQIKNRKGYLTKDGVFVKQS